MNIPLKSRNAFHKQGRQSQTGTASQQFQGECLSPFLFTLFINDMEHEIGQGGTSGVSLGNLKPFLLLYADDAVIFSETPGGLQVALDTMLAYCQRWKIELNTSVV